MPTFQGEQEKRSDNLEGRTNMIVRALHVMNCITSVILTVENARHSEAAR